MANTVSKLANTGTLQTYSYIDEVTNNPTSFGSFSFSGTSQYLTVPNINFGLNNFTIEGWFNPTSVGSYVSFWGTDMGSGANPKLALYIQSGGGNLYLDNGSGTIVISVPATNIVLNTWNHIAVVRAGTGTNQTAIYINGVSKGTGTLSTNLSTVTAPFNIGYIGESGLTLFSGYISNFRIVNGTAVYTSSFTPSNQPLTAVAGTALLLNAPYTGDAFLDSSPNKSTVTNTGSIPSIPQTPFNPTGYYSNYFSNIADFYAAPIAAYQLGSNNFTMECWAYMTALPSTNSAVVIFSQYDASDATTAKAFSFYIYNNAGTYGFYFNLASGSVETGFTSTYTFTTGQWYHLAAVRNTNNVYLFVNGVQVGTTTAYSSTVNTGSGRNLIVGARTQSGLLNLAFQGYISNLRFINGTGLYTSNFVPPINPLTAVTNTVFLTCQSPTIKDNSTTNAVLTQVSSVLIQSNTIPFSSSNFTYTNTNIAVSKQYGNGILQTTGAFDEIAMNPNLSGSISLVAASTQYLTLPTSAASLFTLGTGDFTIEFWVYFKSFVSGASQIFDLRPAGTSSTTNYIVIGASSAGVISTTLSGTTITGPTLSITTWYHIAVVRISGTSKLYVNGVQVGSSISDSISYIVGANRPIIGADGNGPSSTYALNGYISNFRIIKGTGAYTGSFTTPTSPLSTTQSAGTNVVAITNPGSTSLLLKTLQTDTSDVSIYNNTITRISSPLNTYESPFMPYANAYSYSFNGSGQSISAPANTAFAFGTGDFTFECWAFSTDITGSSLRGIFDTRLTNTSTAGIMLRENSAGFLVLTNNSTLFTTTGKTPNVWQHIALVKISGTITLYVNGVSVGSAASATSLTDNYCRISGFTDTQASPYGYLGYISNVRIVKGTGLYTSNFIPPTAPLTISSQNANSSQVSLLTTQSQVIIDNSPNGFTLTNTGAVVPNIQNPFYNNGYYSNYFNGSNQYIDVPNNAAMSQVPPWTVEAWIYQTAAQNCYWYSQVTSGFVQFNISPTLYVQIDRSGVGNQIVSTNPIQLNTWTHIALVADGTNLKLYINGVQSGSTVAWAVTGTSTGVTRIGAYQNSGGSGSLLYPGYISNFRFVRAAVYTANFAPPTAPLTPISNTSVLTCQSPTIVDNSLNAFTLTNTGSVAAPLFQPFPYPTTTPVTSNTTVMKKYNTGVTQTINGFDEKTISPAGQGSISFNGSTQYLTVPNNTAFAFGTGNFTIEAWVYLTAYNASTYEPIFANAYLFYIGSTGQILLSDGAANVVAGNAGDVPINTWVHVAAVRNGTTINLYVNGIQKATATVSASIGSGSPNQIGNYNSTAYFPGYISNLRIVKGVAVYTSAFTPPTAPSYPVAGTSLLLNTQYNNAFVDSSPNALTITNVGSATSVPTNPFYQGYYSNYFNGSTQYLTSTSTTISNFGSNNFTFECWINTTNISTVSIIYDGRATTGQGVNFTAAIAQATAGKFSVYTNSVIMYTSAATLVTNTWYHIAVVRSGTGTNQTSVYINGVLDGSFTNASVYVNPYNTIAAASYTVGAAPFSGYISNLRIINGTALYTSSFVPPTNALTAVANTSLLTCQAPTFADSSNNNFTITATGSPTITNVTPFYPKGY